jgi:hypothetical protein
LLPPADLELGNLTTVDMTNCAVPEDSFSSLLDLMGVGGVRSFTFAEGRGSIQSFHLQGLSALSHLGNYPLPCQYFCFASGLPSYLPAQFSLYYV